MTERLEVKGQRKAQKEPVSSRVGRLEKKVKLLEKGNAELAKRVVALERALIALDKGLNDPL